MASYTKIESVSSCRHMVADGVGNLYIIADNGTNITVYEYEIATDTLTDISGNTFNGHESGSGFYVPIEWWTKNSTLYCVTGIFTGTNEAYVHRWDGGQSWTTVDTDDWSGVATLNALLEGDATRLVWLHSTTGGGNNMEVRASTDGTTWADQTIGGTYAYELYNDVSIRNEILFRRYNTVGPDRRIMAHQSGSTWQAISASDIGTIRFLGTEGTYSFFRSTTTTLYRSTDWGVNTNSIAGTWYFNEEPCVYDLTQQIVGLLGNNSNQDQVRFWNSSTLTFDLDGTPNAGNTVVRKPCYYEGYLYVLVEADGIYRRDDPIGPVPALARFYHGAGTLAERFTLPFYTVAPGSMTLNRALGTVVIGSNAAAGVMVVYSDHPYPTGTATDTGIPTGTTITSTKWV